MGAIWTLWGGFGTTFGVTFWKVACPGSVRGAATCLLLKKHIVGTSKADRRRLSANLGSVSLENKIIGRTTSGNYSFCFDKNLSFGYVNSGNTIETLRDKNLFIEIEKI